jgi:integrase
MLRIPATWSIRHDTEPSRTDRSGAAVCATRGSAAWEIAKPPTTAFAPAPNSLADTTRGPSPHSGCHNASHSDLRTFIMFGLYTAARAGALLELTWDQVDFLGRYIALGRGRGNKRRAVVPITLELRASPIRGEGEQHTRLCGHEPRRVSRRPFVPMTTKRPVKFRLWVRRRMFSWSCQTQSSKRRPRQVSGRNEAKCRAGASHGRS